MNTGQENETYTFNNKLLETTWINPPKPACNSIITNGVMCVETMGMADLMTGWYSVLPPDMHCLFWI
jgi:hypothetical protein